VLLGSQGSHGIDRGCSARGNQCGKGGDDYDDGDGDGVDVDIRGRDIEELAAERSRCNDGDGNGHRDGDAGEDQDFSQDEPDHRPSLRSEGHAYADFAGALGGGVGEDSIQSKAGKQGSQKAKRRGEEGDGALAGDGVVNLGAQGGEVIHDELGVEVGDGGADAGCSGIGRLPGTDIEGKAGRSLSLHEWSIGSGQDRVAHGGVLGVAHHTDNHGVRFRVAAVGHMVAEGVLRRPVVVPGKGLVDDRDFGRGGAVGRGAPAMCVSKQNPTTRSADFLHRRRLVEENMGAAPMALPRQAGA
jgi:hypothetical protein